MLKKIKKLLGKAWDAAKNKDLNPSFKELKGDIKREFKYDKLTNKVVGQSGKYASSAPTAMSGAKLVGKLAGKVIVPYQIGKTFYKSAKKINDAKNEANSETSKNLKDTSSRSDELIAAIKKQRKNKKT